MNTATQSFKGKLVQLLLVSFTFGLSLSATAAIDESKLPAGKRTTTKQYVAAKDVPALLKQSPKYLFVDIRTRGEATYLGMAENIDALVPYVENQPLWSDWDDKANRYKLEPVQDFVPEMGRRLAQKGLTKNDLVVLMCRSGDRSARAATRLAQEGYTKIYSVIDGFEGDMSDEGRRNVNGWKNAGLDWSYDLVKSKMYFEK